MKLSALAVLVWLSTALAASAAPPSLDAQIGSPADAISVGRIASPAAPGPYRVGRQTVTFVDATRDGRLVVVDVWYPVDAIDAAGAVPSEYNLVFASLPSTLALDAPTVSADGPFPLLLFSHGSRGIRFQSYFLTEALASHGFVVAAMDHAGNTAIDLVFNTLDPFEIVVVNRPLDVSFTLDRMLARNDTPGDAFAGSIDPTRVGAIGHSFGGYTALALASGIATVPADLRINTIMPIAPASGLLSDVELGNIYVPALVLGGTADITTPVDDQSTRPFALMPSPDRLQANLVNAGHQSFTNICDFTTTLLDAGVDPVLAAFLLGNAEEGCAPSLMPIAQAHRLAQLVVVAFAKLHVTGDERYRPFVSPSFATGKLLPVQLFEP